MFLGEFEYRIDEKGRVPIPPKFKGELKDGAVVTSGVERCIVVYPIAEWKNVSATLTTGSVTRSNPEPENLAHGVGPVKWISPPRIIRWKKGTNRS